MNDPAPRASHAGRPRNHSLDQAVLDAAAELLGEAGYRDLTMAAVATRAGTTKTAIYRRWTGKTALVIDVLAERLPAPLPLPATGDPAEDLVQAGLTFASTLGDPAVQHGLTGLLAEAASDPSISHQIRERLVGPQLSAAAAGVDQAHKAGLLPEWMTADLIADVLTGATLQHVLIRGEPGDRQFFESIAKLLTSAAGL
jgi:AcrR family transcriptional regulator